MSFYFDEKYNYESFSVLCKSLYLYCPELNHKTRYEIAKGINDSSISFYNAKFFSYEPNINDPNDSNINGYLKRVIWSIVSKINISKISFDECKNSKYFELHNDILKLKKEYVEEIMKFNKLMLMI